MLLVPLAIMSGVSLLFAYTLSYKIEGLRYGLARYAAYVEGNAAYESCQNLGKLYRSYDPEFLIIC